MNWKNHIIYENKYSLGSEGIPINKKKILIYPELKDYFIFFIKHKHYKFLEDMLLEINEDLTDDTGKNLAFLSGVYKSYKLLALAEKIKSSPCLKDQFNVNALMNSCYPNIGYRFFHFYWKNFNQSQIEDFLQQNLTQIIINDKIININFSISRILTNNKNLNKLQYIYKNISLNMRNNVRPIWLKIAKHNQQDKLVEFLSDERFLLLKLNDLLPNKLFKKSKKI